MSQTTYTQNAPTGRVGMVSEEMSPQINTHTAGGVVSPGQVVSVDATASKPRGYAKLPTTSAGCNKPELFGVVVEDDTREGGAGYAANTPFPVLRKGRCWVQSEGALVEGTHPFIRHTAGAGGSVLGLLRADADTATAVQCTGITVLTDCGAASLVLIEVNL